MLESLINWKKPSSTATFKNIVAHQDLKDVLEAAVWNNERTLTLMIGPPGSAKSLFMSEICDKLKHWYYLDGSTSSGKGLIEFLDEHREAEGICIDECDKLNKKEQACLYNFLENGHVLYQTGKVKYNFWMKKTKVIATSNSIGKLAKPFQSRFLILNVKGYTFDEFVEITVRLCKEKHIGEGIALTLAKIVWEELESRDIRKVKHIRNLIQEKYTPEKVEKLVRQVLSMSTMEKTEFN